MVEFRTTCYHPYLYAYLCANTCCILYICFNLAHTHFCDIDWHRRRGCMSCGILSGYSLMVLGDSLVPWISIKFEWVSESRSVVLDSLRPHGLLSPWNSPRQNIGVGSLSLLQGIFPSQGLNLGLPHCRQILYQLSHKGSPRILEWVAYLPFPGDLPDPGIEPGSPALQADSLPTELSWKPVLN